jgi:glycosyltransferase involved in cell wall biosynthesis
VAKSKSSGIEIVFFSQYKLGGVQNYYRQLIKNLPKDSFTSKWILTCNKNDNAAAPPKPFGITEEVIFEYSDQSKLTLKKLSTLVSNKPGIIMTNFHIELQMLSRYPKGNKTIIHVCHDDFFVDISNSFSSIIDIFIAHNHTYFEKLKSDMPERVKDIFYMPFGINLSPYKRAANKPGGLKILFLARLDKKKGVYDLFEIDELLIKRNVHVDWTIIGDGPEKDNLLKLVKSRSNFTLDTLPDSDSVYKLASSHDIFILPSYLDGLPLALLETMSAGLVPVISRFNSGISRVVRDDIGFIVEPGDIEGYASAITDLNNDRNELDTKSARAVEKILDDYNIEKRSVEYNRFFEKANNYKHSFWYKYSRKYGNKPVSYLRLILNRLFA